MDDMLRARKDRAVIVELKQRLHQKISMKKLRNAGHILGMQIDQD